MIDNFLKDFQPLKIPLLGVRLPEITISQETKNKFKISTDNNYDFLKQLAIIGFNKLKLKKTDPKYKIYAERTKYELETIRDLGFVDYILIVWDVINFCVDNNIPVGSGRGSACGSCLLYLIGVTKIDPIKYNLYFERFISKTRAKKNIVDGITYITGSLCDIDQDICFYKRDKVIAYLYEKYKGKTCRILTFNTLSPRLLIKEMGKIIGMKSEEEMTNITSLIPKIHGVIEDLDKAYETVPDFKKWCDENPRVYQNSLKLVHLNKNSGNHPSGLMISYEKLEDSCPVQLTSDKEVISSYDMNQVALFSLKLDVLGLRGVSVIDDVCKQIGKKLEDIDLNDNSIYQALQSLKYPHGLFQIETDLGFRATQKIKPRNFEQISAVLALNRPGSMKYIDDYAKFTNDGTILETESPELNEILKETGGIPIFQETLMLIANKVFKLSLEDAEMIRYAIGKKKKEEMLKYEEIIKQQGKKLNLEKSAKFYWDILLASADYSFNKCLSPDTVVETPEGYKMMFEISVGDEVKSYDIDKNKNIFSKVLNIHENQTEIYEIELEDGRKIKSSLNHKYLCEDKKMRTLEQILLKKHKVLTD